jgi:ribonuclease P protein component
MILTRLSKKTDIDLVGKKGRSVRDLYCGMRFIKNDFGFVRIAFVIGTKTDKRAVVRNRLRRQYREVAQALLGENTSGFDILFYPTKLSATLSYEERLEKLRAILQANKLIT